MTHHVDCDGWITTHGPGVQQVSRAGRGMWQAGCECGWQGTLVGADAVRLAERQANEHYRIEPCAGQCTAEDAA